LQILAEVFQDLLSNKEDYLRAIRALFREICRVARQDINYTDFCLGLMQERTQRKFRDLDPVLKERMFIGVADLISLTILLCVTPGVREAASALVRGDHKGLLCLFVAALFENILIRFGSSTSLPEPDRCDSA
jgi:integrator complex subunit 1